MSKKETVRLIDAMYQLLADNANLPTEMPGTDWNPQETKSNRIGYFARGMADQLWWVLSGGAKPAMGAKSVALQSAEILARKRTALEDARSTEEDVDDSKAIAEHDAEFAVAVRKEFDEWKELYETVSGGVYKPREYKVTAANEHSIDADIAKKLAALG